MSPPLGAQLYISECSFPIHIILHIESTVVVALVGMSMHGGVRWRRLAAGTVTLPEGLEMVMPGDNVTVSTELLTPVALEPGLRFAVREGSRTVAAGVVSKVL